MMVWRVFSLAFFTALKMGPVDPDFLMYTDFVNTAVQKTVQNIKMSIPIVLGILMLIQLVNPVLQPYYGHIFTGSYIIDPLIGAIFGTISFGIPVASYVTGGELLKSGVSLIAVTAFILSWSTVYFFMLPLEIAYLGKRFAILRNVINFGTSIIIAILTIATLNFFV
jgi:hypothetical protein